ncbi:hypothetical protein VST7929_02985 [Vibrio stylophorae]|uniref:Uncharacterized protein n=1 Tax=Vibrio stylophorae TaxID=659351 RepID=A0ABM8ZXE6_9VIBR|nr:hypothetical protein [Vibrio stylophorae]CAH0535412.1 hypothetical protein VST7929_02985 [Vibrio stylophorae]
MIIYLFALTLFLLIMLLMSIGIIFHRQPMQNRCRSLRQLGFYPLSCQYLYGPALKGQYFDDRSSHDQSNKDKPSNA